MSVLVLAAPALPLHAAGKYVAGAYIVFLALVLVYVAIMARRLTRSQRELAELRREAERARARDAERDADREPVLAGRLTPPPPGEPGRRAEA